MDEIDAIGGRRFSEGTSADREIQRTLMELLNQLDGFDQARSTTSHFLKRPWGVDSSYSHALMLAAWESEDDLRNQPARCT